MAFSYYIIETQKKVFESVTICNRKSKEKLTIKINNISNGYIKWILNDNSRIFNTTKANYFDYKIGQLITFYRQSDPNFKDEWEILSFDMRSRDDKKVSYIYKNN